MRPPLDHLYCPQIPPAELHLLQKSPPPLHVPAVPAEDDSLPMDNIFDAQDYCPSLAITNVLPVVVAIQEI